MPATTTPGTAIDPGVPDLLHPLGPVLVATDGTAESRAALVAAAQLAAQQQANIIVLTVFVPMTPVAGDFGLLVPPIEAEEARREELLRRVREQVANVAGRGYTWRIEMRTGDPATVVARSADEFKARMIVSGLGEHEMLDRILGGETALHILRRANVPVFAVPPTFNDLPRRVAVATDFSMASVHAARAAIALFDTISTVYVVHVAPKLERQPEAFAAWMMRYGENLGPALERVKAELEVRPGITFETVLRHGRAAQELLAFAEDQDVDLVVTGSRGAGLIERILVGSTATALIRGTNRPLLAVPAPAGTDRGIEIPRRERVTIPEERWAEELNAFTKRNAGRRASLEVDDPELGAQAQEHDYPFLGAAYDHHDRRVEIMLGDFIGVKHHLTRGIADVREIDILQDERGRDRILRVAHGNGQTILTLES